MLTFTLFHTMLWWDCGRALATWEPTAAGFLLSASASASQEPPRNFPFYFFGQKLLLLLVSREALVIVWSLSKHADTKHTTGPGLY